jgi:hypothetical protein
MSSFAPSISLQDTTEPFNLQVSRNQIDRHKAVFKFGYNDVVGSTEETVWSQGGIYSYPASATVMTVSSSSANDTAAGTGARTVQVYGLDANYNEIDELITLNGQTAVSTTKSYLRAFRMIVQSAGSGGVNAGIIYMGTGTVTAGVPANKYALVDGFGDNQTMMLVYTIPAGFTAYMTQNNISTAFGGNTKATLNCRLVARPFGQVFQSKERITIVDGTHSQIYTYPLVFTEKTDLEYRAKSSSGAVDFSISGSFELLLISNTAF